MASGVFSMPFCFYVIKINTKAQKINNKNCVLRHKALSLLKLKIFCSPCALKHY